MDDADEPRGLRCGEIRSTFAQSNRLKLGEEAKYGELGLTSLADLVYTLRIEPAAPVVIAFFPVFRCGLNRPRGQYVDIDDPRASVNKLSRFLSVLQPGTQ
jgi:hypothetical protein